MIDDSAGNSAAKFVGTGPSTEASELPGLNGYDRP